MRNEAEQRREWASYVRQLRAATGLSLRAFGEKIKTDAATVSRWEHALQKPESTEKPELIAEAYGVPLDEPLSAAGLKPGETVPVEPTVDIDQAIRDIRASGLSARVQKKLIDMWEQERADDEARRIARVREMIKMNGGKVA